MLACTATANPWPARFGYAAALIFTGASGTLNVAYGVAKGSDFSSKLVWGSVAAAVAVTFALSWPALIASLDRRQWSRAVMALIALLLTGTYSVSAALGSAMGGRTNATLEEQDTADKRAKAQTSYNSSKAELDSLKAARPVAELEPLVEATRPVCRIVVTSGSRETLCAKPAALVAELGRAKRRAQLEDKMAKASTDLATNKRQVANSDAVALARYASDLGWAVDADYMNKLLVLLAVLVIECAGGLSIAVAMALAPDSRRVEIVHPVPLDTGRRERAPAGLPSVPDAQAEHRTDARTLPSVRPTSVSPLIVQPSGVQDWLAGQGGRTVISMRRLASVLGRSPSAVHDELRRLQASGALTLAPGPRGTAIALRPN